MTVQVSSETTERARAAAKEVYDMLVPSYRYDGARLTKLPPVTIRDAIIGKLVEPGDLVRVQLVYPEDGPDDHWQAACELLLGAGLEHDGSTYKVLGGSNSIKKGVVWLSTEAVRRKLHRFFGTAQEALTYMGVFFSGCHHGIHHLDDMRGSVVHDGEEGTADGMGFISLDLLRRLGLPTRQIQVRLVADREDEAWLAKGTLHPRELAEDVDVLMPDSMLKGAGSPSEGKTWSCWFGVRDIAESRSYASSFSFAQWFDDQTLKAVWPVVEDKLAVIRQALSNREGALRFLGLMRGDGTLQDARMKAEAFLQAGIGPDHPWLNRQLVQLMRKAYVQLATGGGIELTGRMGAWADLPDGVVCVPDEPAGPLVLSRYPVRDPHSIQAVWNEPDAVSDALPGSVYLNNDDALLLDGDFDGDYFITCSQTSVVDTVSSPQWYPGYRRQDVPPKRRRKDPLSALPYVAVSAIGGVIGTMTYAISGALHEGKVNTVAPLSAALQASVMAIKWDTDVDRSLLQDPDLQIPQYIADAKSDRDLFVKHAETVGGDFPLIRNYNRVVEAWRTDAHTTRPLVHFKANVPLWAAPSALNHVEEVAAVVQTFNRWIADIIRKVGEPSQDDLAGPLEFLRGWETSRTSDRYAWATALWHVTHGTRASSTASAAFHAFSDEMVRLIAEHAGLEHPIKVPKITSTDLPRVEVVPLVGAVKTGEENGVDVRRAIANLPETITVETRPNGGANAAFWAGELYLGQVPGDHTLYSAIPAGLTFTARPQLRGRTVYLLVAGK